MTTTSGTLPTDHDEGFAAGIEAAAQYVERSGVLHRAPMAAAIRALKPAPRSAEHTAALATAPSTRIKAAPVYQFECDGSWFDVTEAYYRQHDGSAKRVLYVAPPDHTPDARSTDSSAEAVDGNALRDEFEQWYVENAFDFKRNPIGSGLCGQQWFAYAGAKGLSHAEANIVLLDRMARAEAAKLTTAPHTADEKEST